MRLSRALPALVLVLGLLFLSVPIHASPPTKQRANQARAVQVAPVAATASAAIPTVNFKHSLQVPLTTRSAPKAGGLRLPSARLHTPTPSNTGKPLRYFNNDLRAGLRYTKL